MTALHSTTSVSSLLYLAFGGRRARQAISAEVIQEIAALTNVLPTLKEGAMLFEHRGNATHVFVVRSGYLKGELTDRDGDRQITDFYLTGDFVNIQSVCTLKHEARVSAITTASVVAIPLNALLRLAREHADVQERLHTAIGRELLKLDDLVHRLCRQPVSARIAAFFMQLSERLYRLGNEADRFYFPVRRADIASFLNMDRATFTRGFRELERRGLLTADGYEIRLLDPDGLTALALEENAADRTRRGRQ